MITRRCVLVGTSGCAALAAAGVARTGAVTLANLSKERSGVMDIKAHWLATISQGPG